MTTERAERFENLRPALVRHAYRMLGEYGEAEDVAQDAYLRWSSALDSSHVEDERALARTIVTRLCLDRLRSARAKREVYLGPWLPGAGSFRNERRPGGRGHARRRYFVRPDAGARTARAVGTRGISYCTTCSTFRLRKSPRRSGRGEPAVRKLASRAREHVRDAGRHSRSDPRELVRVRDEFLAAIQGDDPARLAQLLTEDVVFTSDGGGKAPAATVPLIGRERVTKFIFGLKEKSGWRDVIRMDLATLNGMPGIVTFNAGGVQDVTALEIVDGRIAAMYVVRNPEKLQTLDKAVRHIGTSKQSLA